jgi:pimeloyl-ACP methyl ester carboxylesterase
LEIGPIGVPHRTLVVSGRDDWTLPLDAGLHVFPRCGHRVQWERAYEFNLLATSFLTETN